MVINNQSQILLLICFITLYSVSGAVIAQETESTSTTASATEHSEESDDKSSPQANKQTSKPAFDVDMLVERMKETDAIGFITKLSLKNQVDDLLEEAEKLKSSSNNNKTSALRESFEGLILKTVALLNKGEDFTLAEDIYLAKEQLWRSIMENKA